MYLIIKIYLFIVLSALMAPAAAQITPDAGEIAAYRGLLAAAAKGDAALAEKLIAGGADVNERDGYRRTPLQLARGRGYREMVQILEQAGGH